MRILVVGAGVIGQVYAGRLASAGHSVTVVARGDTASALHQQGIRLTVDDRQPTRCPVDVIGAAPEDGNFDWGLLAVRLDQLEAALADVEHAPAECWMTLCNIPEGAARVAARLGTDRTVLAFPGVGGRRGADGVIRYADVARQHTTVAAAGGTEQSIVRALRGAGFAVDIEADMAAWLTTHAVFIAGVGAAILGAGGDAAALGRDRAGTSRMVRGVGEGFTALQLQGIRPVPGPLRAIFTRVPRAIAVPYWQRQLRGTVGVDAIAPHVRATRSSELPALVAGVRHVVGSSAPLLDRLLVDAGL